MNQKSNHSRCKPVFSLSLLIKEPSKRIQLLEKARKISKEKNSDILNFELAKLYFKIIYPIYFY